MSNKANLEITEQKHQSWKKGGPSPNPTGRPKGSRNKTTLAVQSLLENEGERITRKAIELALAGDMTAIKCVMERLLPPRKHSPLYIELPEVHSIKDSLDSISIVIQSVANGEITTQEGLSMVNLLERFTKTIELSELEQRLTNLEKAYE